MKQERTEAVPPRPQLGRGSAVPWTPSSDPHGLFCLPGPGTGQGEACADPSKDGFPSAPGADRGSGGSAQPHFQDRGARSLGPGGRGEPGAGRGRGRGRAGGARGRHGGKPGRAALGRPGEGRCSKGGVGGAAPPDSPPAAAPRDSSTQAAGGGGEGLRGAGAAGSPFPGQPGRPAARRGLHPDWSDRTTSGRSGRGGSDAAWLPGAGAGLRASFLGYPRAAWKVRKMGSRRPWAPRRGLLLGLRPEPPGLHGVRAWPHPDPLAPRRLCSRPGSPQCRQAPVLARTLVERDAAREHVSAGSDTQIVTVIIHGH